MTRAQATIGLAVLAAMTASGEAINVAFYGSALFSILFSFIVFCFGVAIGGSLVEYIEDDK